MLWNVGSVLFDRVINLNFYDSTGKPVSKIECPELGMKPDITIKGALLAQDLGLTTEIVITNFAAEHAIDDCSYVVAEYGYGQGLRLQRRKMWYSILYVDDAKQPPDRQITFHCLPIGMDSSVMSLTYKDAVEKDAKQPPKTAISKLLKDWISAYNKSVKSKGLIGEVKNAALLSEQVVIDADPTEWATIQLLDSASDRAWTYYQYLQYLNEALVSVQVAADGTKISAANMCIVVDGNTVRVIPTQYSDLPLSSKFNSRQVTHVIAASRNGPTASIKMPFRPDINCGDVIELDADLIMGRSVAGLDSVKTLIPIGTGAVSVYLLPGAQFEFGTVTGQNYIAFKGTILS